MNISDEAVKRITACYCEELHSFIPHPHIYLRREKDGRELPDGLVVDWLEGGDRTAIYEIDHDHEVVININ